MGGDDHWERATFWGSDGMLKFFNVVSNMKCRPSSIHWVCGDCGQSRAHCDFKWSNRGQSARYAAHLQSRPAVKSLSSPEARTTTLTSSSEPTFSNTSEYSRQTLKGLVKDRTVRRQTTALPLVKRVHWCPVSLDEINMRDRN